MEILHVCMVKHSDWYDANPERFVLTLVPAWWHTKDSRKLEHKDLLLFLKVTC